MTHGNFFSRIYFQVDYISSLKDMLAPYFEVKSQVPSGGFSGKYVFLLRSLDLSMHILLNLMLMYPYPGIDDSMVNSDKVMANRARFFNTMNNFLTWCALRQYINFASRPFRKAHQEFYKGLMGGKSVDQR